MTKNIDWGSYSQILFISKSIGTINAVAYSNGCELPCRHILFTPLEGTFSLPIKEGIAFHGTADPWADTQKIRNLAKAKNVPLTIIDDANHSLETGDIVVDIKNLETVMQQVKDYVMAPSPERMSAWQSNPHLGHITTFGGHPVCCAAALASLKLLLEKDWIGEVDRKSNSWRAKQRRLSSRGAICCGNIAFSIMVLTPAATPWSSGITPI